MKKISYVFLLILGFSSVFAFDKVKSSLVYQNELGSVLSITATPLGSNYGSISGSFTTKVAAGSCQSIIGKPYPVTGWYNNNNLSVTVSWPDCESIVVMEGAFASDGESLDLMWLLQENNENNGEPWYSKSIGNDTYKLISNS